MRAGATEAVSFGKIVFHNDAAGNELAPQYGLSQPLGRQHIHRFGTGWSKCS